MAAKGPSAVGTGLRRDDPPPDDTVSRCHLDNNLWPSGLLVNYWKIFDLNVSSINSCKLLYKTMIPLLVQLQYNHLCFCGFLKLNKW